ncbi:YegP family protein [Halorientalis halophila]|uniref:YegP family protein n=1 Tax=Halorientalis halophila TaxID=3108499 RepID=UPI003008971D
MNSDPVPDADDRLQFEVSPTGSDWQWLLRDDRETLAHSLETYSSVNETLAAIDRLWTVLSSELYEGVAGFETVEQDGTWIWRLVVGERGAGRTLAIGSNQRATTEEATDDINRFRDVAPRAQVRLTHPPEEQLVTDRFEVGRVGRPLRALESIVGRGKRHRKVLKEADIQIAVSGIRGKSSTAKRLDDVFNRRGYDTLTKITGDRPTLIRNGAVVPIERHSPRVTLYENVEFFQRLGPTTYESPAPDVAIVENQAITEYTMRMVNERFLDPDIVVLCNVRRDHTETLGADRQRIARAFGRSIPAGTHVVSGEQHPVIHEYLREEIEKRNGTISQVDVPERHRGLVSAETVYALEAVLERLDEPPLPADRIAGYLERAQPSWSIVSGQRVFNAAKANDIESTEAIRRALVQGGEHVLPFVYLRSDRRGRSASFAEYMNILAERDCIDRVHVGGDHRRAFVDALDVPCESHSPAADPAAVLDELLADGRPILFMGNTVAPFMREMERLLAERTGGSHAVADLDEQALEGGVEVDFESASTDSDTRGRLIHPGPSSTARGRYEVYEDRAGEYRWRLRDEDETIRADSGEGYVRRGGAVSAVGRFSAQSTAVDIEVYEDKSGGYRWRARSSNGRIVADGTRAYDTRAAAERMVERIRPLAANADVVNIGGSSDEGPAADGTGVELDE